MTNATKARAQRRRQTPPPRKRSPWVERGLLGALAVVIVIGAAVFWRVTGGDQGTSAGDAGPVHVHGLGINPADQALFIATHTGLFRVGEGESKAVRVGEGYQDTMGFAVIDESRYLGSGHPDLRTDLPPLLGLIESTDQGKSWEPISLLGEADFHVLRSAGDRVYGYDASNDRLLVSDDAGRKWDEVERPAPLVDLAIDPDNSSHVVAAGASDLAQGLYESHDGGRAGTASGPSSAFSHGLPRSGSISWTVAEKCF